MGRKRDSGTLSVQPELASLHEPELISLIRTFAGHFRVRTADLSPEERDLWFSDWLRMLLPKPFRAVEAARDRWLMTQTRMPTLAEFLVLVDEIAGKTRRPQSAEIGPAPACLSAARHGVPFANLTGPEKWSWYARMHAFRDDYPELGGPPPFDPAHRFDDLELTRQAKEERHAA